MRGRREENVKQDRKARQKREREKRRLERKYYRTKVSARDEETITCCRGRERDLKWLSGGA